MLGCTASVLLADDHVLLLELLRDLLTQEFSIVGTATDGSVLLQEVSRLAPDIVVTDIRMPTMDGLLAGETIKRKWPKTKLVFLTADADSNLVSQALSLGAEGFLLKRCASTELLQAMRVVRDGAVYYPPCLSHGDHGRSRECSRTENIAARQLTPRTKQVLALLVQGLPMKEVARRLEITARTVAFHKYSAMTTLGLRGNADLVDFAIRTGLLGAGR
ncbi:MAG TPA: response regulator transcription factor [Acetobacteraceae bacterium]|nr:response regulator transcription factor [Acetobacteraceae bacterium]